VTGVQTCALPNLVSKDTSRVRTIVTAIHTKEDLDEAVDIFEKVGKRLNLI
jgi:glycine C-acetyltransferase